MALAEPANSIAILPSAFTRQLPHPKFIDRRQIRFPTPRFALAQKTLGIDDARSERQRGLTRKRNRRLVGLAAGCKSICLYDGEHFFLGPLQAHELGDAFKRRDRRVV